MKYLLPILLSLTIIIVSCNNEQNNLADQTFDTVIDRKPNNPFLSDDEFLFYSISDSVYHHLKIALPNHPHWGKIYTKEYQSPLFSYQDYVLIDSMARVLYAPSNFSHTSDSDWEVNINGLLEYLNWELWQILKPYIGRQWVVNLMEKESAITDSLIVAQQDWFRTHFDATQEWIGSTYNLKYYRIRREMLYIENENMKELLQCLTDSTYVFSQLPNIPNSVLRKESNHILNYIIPYYENDSVYNASLDRTAFLQENQWWEKLIRIRKKIRELIREDAVKAFDNGSSRLMFNRLRQLKNEYEAYTILTIDKQALTLSDSCTYEELMAYPNFTTKWNEYIKQFE